ncbi:MAG: tyrosine-type recombinase/integrase [Oscillatoriales cyanobacterium RM1_1_9]|nr:tyrosine-type recombinase/integrase [Oscillatoriales cyanobacterium SM2_3_0]NJO45685.1 tyrosine-type recombinase/integrase [Oscillatoriales cyanobacterium RM2_1_1]NJO70522.1 tyrosine-type recombinase/integrase [Oscillatoriales cyanobacterium RM1_1_9]
MEPTLQLPEIRLIPCNSAGMPGGLKASPATDLRQVWRMEFLATKAIAPNTHKAYNRELEKFMAWTTLAWEQVTPRLMAQYKQHLRESGLTASSINRALSALKSFFRWLRQAERISRNPAELIELEPLQPPVAQDLYPEQVAALQQALTRLSPARQVRDRALLAVLTHGLRAAEVSALNVEDYDGTRLHILQAKDGSTGTVPLHSGARIALQAYLDWRGSEADLLGEKPLFVTLNPSQQRLGYQSIRSAVRQLGHQAGIPGINPHQLRHTFGTQLVAQGLDPAHVQVLMRHRSGVSTERYVKRVRAMAAEIAFLKLCQES